MNPPGAEPGFKGDGDLGSQGRKSMGCEKESWWWIHRGKGAAGAGAHPALTINSPLSSKLLFVQAPGSWKCAAPLALSTRLCSSPVKIPSKEVVGLGTAIQGVKTA